MNIISSIRAQLRAEADRARFLDKRIREIEAELQRIDSLPVDDCSISLEQVIDDVQARRARRRSYASYVLQFPETRQEAPR